MEQKNVGKFYADNVNLVHTVARKGYNRFVAIGASIAYEDVVQDMSMVFIKSFERYNSETGKFSSYFYAAAYNELNKIGKIFEEERIKRGVKSVEEMQSFVDDDDGYFELVSERATPYEEIETASTFADFERRLSPIAKLIVSWMMNPPQEVEAEYQALSSHVAMCREGNNCGLGGRRCQGFGIGFVCDLLQLSGIGASAIKKARREIEKSARGAING